MTLRYVAPSPVRKVTVARYGLDEHEWQALEDEVLELFTALLRVDTTNGNETEAALVLQAYLAEDGIEQWRAESLENERQFLEYQIEDPDRHIGGEWWSIPFANGTTETTRARDGIGALGVFLEEDSSSNEARVQPVRIYGAPRIYEITGPQDWANLVDTYPLPVPASRRSVWYDTTGEYRDWFIPDWVSVSADYDAVHLTMMAYLTTPGVAIPLSANAGATVLAGWDPDATFWLRSNNITVDDDPTG